VTEVYDGADISNCQGSELLSTDYFHRVLRAPNTTLSSPAFGRFPNQANQPRKWQFSARVSF